MDTKRDDRNIYFKDLLFAALRRWRTVLVVAAILGILFGAFQYISSAQSDTASTEEAYQQALEAYELNYGSLSAKIDVLKESLRTQQIYMEQSVFMKLNPYGFYEAALRLYVDTGYQIDPNLAVQDPDKTAAVLAAYEAVFLSDAVAAQIAQAAGTQTQYAAEVILCTPLAEAGTLTVTVRCLDEKIGTEVLKVLAEQVETARAAVSGSVTAHTVTILNQSVTPDVDLTLVAQQADVTNRTATQQKALKEAEQQLAALAMPKQKGTSSAALVKSALLFAAIGCILGAFLTVCVIWVLHIVDQKVYSARTLKDRTGIKILGCLPGKAGKTALDRWLLKKEGRCLTDSKEQAALLAAHIRNRCGDAKHILLTGSAGADSRDELLQALQTAMPAITFTNAENICNSAEAQNAMALCDAAVLVEQCGTSCYDAVIRQTEILDECNKTIIGCVVLDG